MSEAWIEVRPSRAGGKRDPNPPSAKMDTTGRLFLSTATVNWLDNCQRVVVQLEPESRRIRLLKADDPKKPAWALTGGGNTPARISLGKYRKKYPQFVGEYQVIQISGGVELQQVES